MSDPISIAHLVITAGASLVSGVIGGWVAAHKAGRRQQKSEDDIAHIAEAVEGMASKETVKVGFENAKSSRKYLRDEMLDLAKRLDLGDQEFKKHIAKIAGQATRLEATADNLNSFRAALGQFVTKGECERTHDALDRAMAGAHK